ncbi:MULTISPECIES: SlyX family protein [unclassified Paracoccus (in: a-proteobacteria)]|uniref:SlyX family protein n=1 Tax=unclassified Paracoccus (in: a-proteobacteria) TaxID=2688777 RepID=UPI0021E145A3|nr:MULTISPECIES: SlyX family protein [unclassified Paracoccus (in: a-proteobacteria)]UXU73964.1 SlyX family protein [Paracoccus sp. SMMA_5]UXU79851.1 SlyX family protein [Paracoccus sp. SMMA_5_TC]
MDKHERIERLEEAVAHLSRIAEDLSEVVARQEGEIARLARRVGLLMEREAEREAETGTIPLADQRPPHW